MTEQISRLTLAVDSARAKANSDSLAKSLDKTTVAGQEASVATKATAQAFKFAATAAASYIGALSFGKVVTDLQKVEGINIRLAALTGDLAGSQQFLSSTAKELSQDYATLADGYARLLPLYDGGLITLSETQEITRGLANASVALGAGQAQLGQAIYGLSQGLSAGTLRAEEFNQVTEPLPGLINKIDAAAGLAAGGFRKLVNEGKVTSSYFKDVLIKALEAYEGSAAAASGTIAATFTRTSNAYLDAVQAFQTPISAATTAPAEALAVALETVAENADLISDAAAIAGSVLAANFGARALTTIGEYSTAIATAASNSAKLAAVRQAGVGTAAAEAASRLRIAAAAAAETAAEVASLEAKIAKLPVDQQSGLAAQQLALARSRASVATAALSAAETSALATTTSLTAAQRASVVATGALGVATRGLSGAMALVGGPLGTAVLAAGAVAYFAFKSNESEKTIDGLSDVMTRLAEGFYKTGQAAKDAADNEIAQAIARIKELRDEILKIRSDESIFGRLLTVREVDDVEQEIADLQKEIEGLTARADQFAATMASAARYDAQSVADAAPKFDLLNAKATEARAVLDKLVPKDAELRQLDVFAAKLEDAFNIKAISSEEYAKGNAAIQARINAIKGLTVAQDEGGESAEDYAKRVKAALDSALPQEARLADLKAQIKLLSDEYANAGADADKFGRALDALAAQVEPLELEIAGKSLEEFRAALSKQLPDPFSDYVTDLKLLTNALDEFPDKAQAIRLAISQLDFNLVAELTVVEGSENREIAEQTYRYQIERLREYWAVRATEEETRQAQLIALARNYAGELRKLHDAEFREIEDFIKQATKVAPDSIGVAFEVDADAARSAALAIKNESLRTDALLAIETAYQEKKIELVRAGYATEKQMQEASTADQFAGLINRYDKQISMAYDFADALLGLKVVREKAEADAALSTAKNLADEASRAQKLYEQTGTEANKELAKQAAERAKIAEATAKREFDQQKKAQLQQAKLSQLMAIINAYATGGSWYTGVALAVIAKLKTQQVIDQLKSNQFNGGSSTLSNLSGSAGDISRIGGPSLPATPTQQTTDRLVIVSGNFKSEDEAMVEVGRAQEKLMQRGLIIQNDTGQLDFRNLPREVVRL